MARTSKSSKPIESWDESIQDVLLPISHRLERQILRYLLDELNPKARLALLDVGCGHGEILSEVASRQLTCVGLESSPAMAAISQKNVPQAQVVLGNGLELPFELDSFDYITALDLCQYFIHPAQGLKEIQRVLKKRGKALLFLPNAQLPQLATSHGWMEAEDQQRIRAYPYKIWRYLLKRSGMKIVKLQPLWVLKNAAEFGAWEQVCWKCYRFLGGYLKHVVPHKWYTHFVCICQK